MVNATHKSISAFHDTKVMSAVHAGGVLYELIVFLLPCENCQSYNIELKPHDIVTKIVSH